MNEPDAADDGRPARRFRKRWILWLLLVAWGSIAAWNVTKPMPVGTDVETPNFMVAASDVTFLDDLTRADATGAPIREQRIFDEVFAIVDGAESFVVADFFLLNDMMGADSAPYRPLSRQFADHLLARKASRPALKVLLVTDPINEVYGGVPSQLFEELRAAGIDVVTTDLTPLRDSNPAYSALWRMFVRWLGNSPGRGGMPNPFDTEPASVSLRSWLALLNFKANHRKLIVADRSDGALVALVTSANPHDASSSHSNVALRFSGELPRHIVDSEIAIARLSGWSGHIPVAAMPGAPAEDADAVKLSFLTEEAIADHLLAELQATRNGDEVRLATFYLSDRRIVDELANLAARGVKVRLILDPNRDAFGRQKDGVPNRPVANELVERSDGRVEVRWYRTHGEQFHTKIALITRSERFVASVGSANLTRRNIGNYNLEANVALETNKNSTLAREMTHYFDRLWNNEEGVAQEFTAPFGAYQDADRARYWRYRLMEATGLSTF
jgi:phosphatidylserine/phosphatidylglycerophosphate/cardiolipin synthase-like enzyme